MTLHSIVETAFHTGLLTERENQQLTILIQQGRYSEEELNRVNHLIEALIEGSVAAERDPRHLEPETPSLQSA